MITINGRPFVAAGTLLELCRREGIEVPALCKGEGLSAGGHCRSCMVEQDGRWVAACTTPARDGAQVATETEALRNYRRDLGELIRSESAPEGWCAEHLDHWGVDGLRYPKLNHPTRADASHPYLKIDLARCIACRRCLKACEEVQGQFVWAVEGRGKGARLTWGSGDFSATDCVACGACVATCPTEAISDGDRRRPHDRTVRTTCGYCGVGCQLEVKVGDRIAFIDGAPIAPNFGHLCVKGRYAHGFVDHADRLRTPLLRKDGQLVPASWDETLDFVANRLLELKGSVAGLSSSRCTNEENYLFQKLFRSVLSTNDVDCCARVCHAPSAAGLRQSLGTGAATNHFADLAQADVLMAIGTNATEAHPVVGARIRQAALNGAKLIVIDPRRTELAQLADVHLQLRPGANVALFNSLAAVLVEESLLDSKFIEARAEGFDDYQKFIGAYLPEDWQEVTGVPAELVRRAARLYGKAARPMMVHGLGVTEHFQGSEGVMCLVNLALLTGAIGRVGVGVNPLRGQNNVQGAADMGCQPDSTTGYQSLADPDVRARLETIWGATVPVAVGRMLPAMYDDARAGKLRGLFILGEDVVQTDPDQARTLEALRNLELLVVQELFLSETAKLAHVVLPAASFLEKEGTFTNGERRVQRVREVVPPIQGSRPDWWILLELFKRMGAPQKMSSPAEIFAEIAQVWPAFGGLSHQRLESGGLQWPVPAPDHPGTPILHTEKFPRGKGRLTRVEYENSPSFGSPLTLVTGRVLEHYNAGTMTRRTPNVALAPQDWLEINPTDAQERQIVDGSAVKIVSAYGEAQLYARVTDRVAPGVVFSSFHFPEGGINRVTSDVQDRVSRCPEYKVTAVTVTPG